ncbi:MAG: hypothetical protein ACKV22_19830 [Bryobacteraceae bacterium]
MSRWQARQTEQRPPKLKIDYDVLKGDALAEKLACFIGILSDAAVHFTPEFLSRLDFQEGKHGTAIISKYLEADDHQLALDLKMLASVHLLILKTIDRCCDGGLSGSNEFRPALQDIARTARLLYDKYPFMHRPELEKELQEPI